MSAPRISVVLCSLNGADTLPTTIGALQRQTLAEGAYEVIVVDDGSTDATAAVAEEWGARVVRLPVNGGISAARNHGWRAARAPVVAFTDDDCEPEPDWLEQLLAGFAADPDADAVGGVVVAGSTDGTVLRYLEAKNPLTPLPQRLLASNSLPYRLRLYLEGLWRVADAEAEPPRELYSMVGANMAFRREALESIGGFDERFRFAGEEEDACRRLHRRPGGARIVLRPQARMLHHFEPELRDTLRRARAYGKANGRTALKHDDVRLIVYPFPVAVGAAVAAGALRRDPRLLAGAAALPLALYAGWARHAWRRRRAEPLVFGYLQLAQETATMAGEVAGVRAGLEGGS